MEHPEIGTAFDLDLISFHSAVYWLKASLYSFEGTLFLNSRYKIIF